MNSLPHWLKKRTVSGGAFLATKDVISRFGVNTVCASSGCPNAGECYSSGFATFMILGKTCTRSCSFCRVEKAGPVESPDDAEPERIADCVRKLGLKYAVITSVTRDDLADGGSGQFVKVVRALKRAGDEIRIELLIPDFKGLISPVEAAALSGADVIGHNIETVKRLYPVVRKEADYDRSLGVLASIKRSAPDILTKSAILAGLGETVREMLDTMLDLRKAGCDILSIGQYLSPSKEHHPVDRFVPPREFEGYKEAGLEMGFKAVSAGPFVRSSYRAKETYDECCSAAVS